MQTKFLLFHLFAIMVLFTSCTKDTAGILTHGNYRYWKHTIHYDSYQVTLYEYFDVKGRWTVFSNDGNQFRKVKYYDDIPNEYWKLKNDSILEYGNTRYLISSISDKMIVLKRNEDYDTLVAVCEKDIPYKYRRMWDFTVHTENIVDQLYRTKIDSVYYENMKFIYNFLVEKKVLSRTDTIQFYLDKISNKVHKQKIRKMIGQRPILIVDQMQNKDHTFVILPPSQKYGQVFFPIILAKDFKWLEKDTVEICYDYELDEYFMDTMAMSWMYD